MCTMDYKPVCGVWFDPNNGYYTEFTQRTFGNRCSACSDKKVIYVFDGECIPLVMQGKSGAINFNLRETSNCSDSERNVSVCTKEFKPVCANIAFGKICPAEPCLATFDNRCQACNRTDVVAVSEGACRQNSAKRVSFYLYLMGLLAAFAIILA